MSNETVEAAMRTKLSYSPINDAHAIVEVVMFVQFAPGFGDSTIRKLTQIEHDLKDELPKATPIQRLAFSMLPQQGSQVMQQQLIGIEMQSMRRDGSLEWMLRTTENTIAVHCLDYSRWDTVWQKAKGYLDKAFKHLDGSESFVDAVGLKYIDRFLCNTAPEQSNLSDLFGSNNDLIFNRAFSMNSGSLWHCHTGWFENMNLNTADMKCLNQLNVDSSFKNINGNSKLVVTIDHSAIASIPQDKNGLSVLKKRNGSEELSFEDIMNELHRQNKAMMAKLLSKQMATAISLSARSEEA
ncbi:MAG: TIGR04255 family protein [Methylococcales bacterium]